MQPAAPELPPPGTRAGWRGGRGRGGGATAGGERRRPGAASRARPPRPGPHLRPRRAPPPPPPASTLGPAAPSAARRRPERTRAGEGRAGGAGRLARAPPSPRPARRRGPETLARRAPSLAAPAPRSSRRPAPSPAAGARCALPGRGVLPRALALHAPGRTPVTPGRRWGGVYAPREDRPRRWGRDNCLFRGPCLQCDLIPAAHARVPSLRPVKKCKIEPFPVHTKRPIVRMCLVPRLLGRLERSGEAPAADVLSRRGGWPWAGVMCAGVFLNCG